MEFAPWYPYFKNSAKTIEIWDLSTQIIYRYKRATNSFF